uniref:Uncharacterized protein n=1 Tax=Anguilla anguilla TaxID=7936 RepID=A0A0E9QSD3_ANGAN
MMDAPTVMDLLLCVERGRGICLHAEILQKNVYIGSCVGHT